MAQDTGIKIRIRLKAYDHKVIDQSAKQIIDTAIRTGAKRGWSSAFANSTQHLHCCKESARLQNWW